MSAEELKADLLDRILEHFEIHIVATGHPAGPGNRSMTLQLPEELRIPISESEYSFLIFGET